MYVFVFLHVYVRAYVSFSLCPPTGLTCVYTSNLVVETEQVSKLLDFKPARLQPIYITYFSEVAGCPHMFTPHSVAKLVCGQHLKSECFCHMFIKNVCE